MKGFQLTSTTGYRDKHNMIRIIARAHRIAACELSVHLVFSEKVPVPGSDANDIDRDLDEDFWVGLRDCLSVNVIKIMGAIFNPLF